MSGKCIIVAAGDLTVGNVSRNDEDLVIAVDGGLGYCQVLELEPDLILGDFDSMTEGELQALSLLEQEIPDRILRLNPIKDDTDMLAALKVGLERGYTDFRIYGATGGRMDHTLANIQCLLYLKKRDAVGYLIDGDGMTLVIRNEAIHFKKGIEGTLSLFSLGNEARGVSIEGMKYNLKDAVITNDFPIGISNEFIGEEAVIGVEEGELACLIKYVTE